MVEHASLASPYMKDLTLLALTAPVMVPNDYEGGKGYLWTTHPLMASAFSGNYGNPSGLGPNSFFNYSIGIFMVMVGLLEAGLLKDDDITEEGVDLFLRGMHPLVGLWNSGDDNVIMFTQMAARAKAFAYFNSGAHPYFDMEVEQGMTFLGTLFAEERGHRFAFPNPISQVQNFLAPERGFDSPHRPYAAYGWYERKRDFSSNPAHKAIDSLVNDRFEKYFGETLDTQMSRYMKAPRAAGRFNAATLSFLLSPEVIHYKARIEDLDPQILREMFLVIEEETLIATAGKEIAQ